MKSFTAVTSNFPRYFQAVTSNRQPLVDVKMNARLEKCYF